MLRRVSAPDESRSTGLADFANDLVDLAAGAHWRAVILLSLVAVLAFLPGFFSAPPVDRDEARYVQATTQMIETGDFIDIRMHDEPRYHKPVGIYWLQVAAVKLTGSDVPAPVWAYRLPSLMGAIALVLLTYWLALSFADRRTALVAGLMMAACLLLGVEARLAKTDAVLSATILAAIGVLARLWLDRETPPGRILAIVFWVACAIGVLVKGPILPMVIGLTLAALIAIDRSVRWLAPLRPLIGIPVFLAIVLPWFVAIGIVTDGAFFAYSLGQDALGKVAQGQQSHGAPPGYYLLAFWITAWPFAAFLATALPWIVKNRADPRLLFLLAWILPTWIVFEAVVTKLPHYVLPTYPALAILTAMALVGGHVVVGRWWSRGLASLNAAALILGPLIALGLYVVLDRTIPILGIIAIAFLIPVAIAAIREAVGDRPLSSVLVVAISAPLFYGAILEGGLAHIDAINLSPRITEAIDSDVTCPDPQVMTASFREASLIFAVGTDIQLGDISDMPAFLSEPGCRVALVEAGERDRFQVMMTEANLDATPRAVVSGFNLGNARWVEITVFENR